MNTRYPIVLVHGLGMKDTFYMRSWGRIDRVLRARGCTVYKSNVDAFGTVENNAAQLKAEIAAILAQTGAEKVNLIAHSKGGLDAKHMIQHLNMEAHVASLTTLCTPHSGSPIASLILCAPDFLVKIAAFWIDLFWRLMGDEHPDSLAACRELQRVEQPELDAVQVAQGVLCQSFSSSVKRGKSDFVMGIPLLFSRFIEKNRITDGIVPRDSAIFGNYRGECVDGSVSHTEIVDFMVTGKKREKILTFYSALCEELADAGL